MTNLSNISYYDEDIINQEFKEYMQYCLKDASILTIAEHLDIFIEKNRFKQIDYILDLLNVPNDMTLKERISYYQLLEK